MARAEAELDRKESKPEELIHFERRLPVLHSKLYQRVNESGGGHNERLLLWMTLV